MRYPEYLIGWLYDIMESFDFRYTPSQILDSEDRYPGLFYDLSLEGWQRHLIEEQLKGDPDGDE